MIILDSLFQEEPVGRALDQLSGRLMDLPEAQRAAIEGDLQEFVNNVCAASEAKYQARRRARPQEEAIYAVEDLLRPIGRAGQIGLFQWNTKRGDHYWSPQAYQLIGIEPGSPASFDRWMASVHPDDREPIQRMMAEMLEQSRAGQYGVTRRYEYRVVHRDGTIRWLESTVALDIDGGDPVLRGMVRDMTDQKHTEEALRESEAKFRGAFENAAIGFSMTTPDGRFVDANPAYCALTGYTVDELKGLTFSTIIHPDDFAANMRLTGRMLAGQIADFVLENRYVRKDGQAVWVRKSVSLVRSAEGAPLWVIALVEDITERRLAEAALRKSEERERARASEIEALMDAAPAIIWMSRDPECREMIGNRYSYDFLRISQGQNVSKTAVDADLVKQNYHMEKDGRLIPPNELPLQTAAATGISVRDYTAEIIFDDGNCYHLLGNVNPLLDQGGKPYGAIGVFVDITLLRQLEEQQVEAKAQIEVQHRLMEYREKERQGIARDIHDGPIQTLASTGFNIQFIKEAYQDASLRVELEQIGFNIKNAVRELREIVNDLRPPSLIRFGLVKAIRMHSEDIQERHPEINIKLELTEDDGHLSEQACLTLFRIFQEGLNNAVRHSGASVVWVVYRLEQSDFLLELHDNGRGFSVTSNTTDLPGEGHFGLVGMKERAQTVGGELTVVSEPGKGTKICVRGPLLGRNVKGGRPSL